MGYITEDYYNNVYKGEAVSDLALLIERASDIVNMVTGYKIGDVAGISSAFIAGQIQKATAAQVEYIDQNGGTTSGGLSSAALGKFSYSGGNTEDKALICPLVYSYLEPTGLLYRGI
ncbi:MAG TPA: hypothetical protein PKI60_06965 [Oscillospiraceae bacterium]|nr:hypothetical protein [Oscillospiraceae bacterium]